MSALYEEKSGSATIRVYEDLSEISDSMLMQSGTIIAEYEDDENELYVTYEVQGDVNVRYKDEYYHGEDEMPEELKDIIKRGELFDHPDVYVGNNNWFSCTEWSEKGFGGFATFDDVANLENMNPKAIAEDIKELAEFLLDERKKENIERE